MGARYEVHVERNGVEVRVVVDLTDEVSYADADELADVAGNTAGRLLNQIHRNREAAVPF